MKVTARCILKIASGSLVGAAMIATLLFTGRPQDPTPHERKPAHIMKPRNDFTADNARTQRAINALLMGCE